MSAPVSRIAALIGPVPDPQLSVQWQCAALGRGTLRLLDEPRGKADSYLGGSHTSNHTRQASAVSPPEPASLPALWPTLAVGRLPQDVSAERSQSIEASAGGDALYRSQNLADCSQSSMARLGSQA